MNTVQPPLDGSDPDVNSTDGSGATLEHPADGEPGAVTASESDHILADVEGSSLEKPAESDALYVAGGSARRSPKYGRFAVIGGALGLIVALVLAQTGTIPTDQNYTRTDLSIILVGLAVPTGILLAMILALVLDRSRRTPLKSLRKQRDK